MLGALPSVVTSAVVVSTSSRVVVSLVVLSSTVVWRGGVGFVVVGLSVVVVGGVLGIFVLGALPSVVTSAVEVSTSSRVVVSLVVLSSAVVWRGGVGFVVVG